MFKKDDKKKLRKKASSKSSKENFWNFRNTKTCSL